MVKVFYSDHFEIPLPEGHRFPAHKYKLLRAQLISEGILEENHLYESPFAERTDLELAHDSTYIDKILSGDFSRKDQNEIGFPWSESLVRRVSATVGGALAAGYESLDRGFSGQLAGGTHHAHRNRGAGYCVFNDQAIVSLKFLKEGLCRRISILDLDVHQGDGTAAILRGVPHVQVVNLYGEKNFPFRKEQSDLDIALPDNCGDLLYLEKLEEALESLISFQPDLVLYQGGVDGLHLDSLGRLNLSFEGLMERDRRCFNRFKKSGIPVSMALGGGYSKPIDHTVKACLGTYRVAKEVYGF
jgi:acetoin utilization deacetylase AcuC-like enzyme